MTFIPAQRPASQPAGGAPGCTMSGACGGARRVFLIWLVFAGFLGGCLTGSGAHSGPSIPGGCLGLVGSLKPSEALQEIWAFAPGLPPRLTGPPGCSKPLIRLDSPAEDPFAESNRPTYVCLSDGRFWITRRGVLNGPYCREN